MDRGEPSLVGLARELFAVANEFSCVGEAEEARLSGSAASKDGLVGLDEGDEALLKRASD
jgi:hypothetical protein